MSVPSDAERAVHVARLSAGLGSVGMAFDTIAMAHVAVSTVQLVAIALCGALWIWLMVSKRPPSLALGNGAFLILNAMIIVAISSSTALMISHPNWVSFRTNQLGAFAVALLAPPVAWVGIATILGFTGSALLQFALFAPSVRDAMPYGEPWATLAYGGFAIVILIDRLRATRTEREVAYALAEADTYELLARAMVAFRDLANTPLQTIWNAMELLRTGDPRSRELAARIERALDKLVELEELTRPIAHLLRWREGDEVWDPRAILRAISDKSAPA